MATDKILKDIGDIQARLFDHRPVLQGEINFFLQEFEDKRGDREVARLEKALDDTRNLSDNLIPQACQELDCNLASLTAQAKTALAMCSLILEREKDPSKGKHYQDKRAQRQDAWTHFMDLMCASSKRVDERFEQEVEETKNYYREVEEKLHIETP